MICHTSSLVRVATCLFLLVATATGLTGDYSRCQYPTANALNGCPDSTIVVGHDAGVADFPTIQGAINSLPNDAATYTLLVLAGNYTEQLNVTRSAPIRILGQTKNAHSQSDNLVTVYWASANGAGSGFNDNAYTSVLTVAPNLNASLVGSGPTGFNVPSNTPFGNSDFRVYNIDFRNNFAEQSAGPAHAIGISRANASFYFCGFYSYQDSVYVGHLGNIYVYSGEVAGQTDFLYGFGTAWIESSNVTLRGCGGGIIAWKGTNTTFDNKYGCYVANSYVNAANSSVLTTKNGKCSLGRPWNSLHRSVYSNTFMDSTILPQGYTTWSGGNFDNLTFMAEYRSYGPGWNETARLDGQVTKVLGKEADRPYRRPRDVFMTPDGKQPNIGWIDPRFLNC